MALCTACTAAASVSPPAVVLPAGSTAGASSAADGTINCLVIHRSLAYPHERFRDNLFKASLFSSDLANELRRSKLQGIGLLPAQQSQ